MPVLLVDDSDGITEITLNRPEKRNALNQELQQAIVTALQRFDADDRARIAILTGADPAFCAGMDLSDLAWSDRERNERAENFAAALRRLGKPVIAAVNGAAVTGGFELALGCDFIIASERAFFGDTHLRVGVFPGGGMSVHLAEAIGVRRARQLSFTGEMIDASNAERLGIVNEVVPHDSLMPRVREVAATIAALDQSLLADIRASYRRGLNLGLDAALEAESQYSWQRHVGAAAIAANRDDVITRGRGQLRP